MSQRLQPNRLPAWSRELDEALRQAVAAVRFGTVTLVIQDGRVVQLDKNEKIRLA